MEQHRLLLHDRDLPRAATPASTSAISWPSISDAAAVEVVQPLDELDEGRLARARPPDKADALARRDARPTGRRRAAGRARHSGSAPGRTRCRRARSRSAWRPGRSSMPSGSSWNATSSSMSLIDRWRLCTCVADVAQVAVDHAKGREHEGDVAQRRRALPPEQQREPDHATRSTIRMACCMVPVSVAVVQVTPGARPPACRGPGQAARPRGSPRRTP